jgi:acetyl-CoA acetyltransferase
VTPVYLSGVGVTAFGNHGATPVVDLGTEAARAALGDAGIEYSTVGEVFGSSMLSPPQTCLRIAHRLGRTGVPVTALESASAGGLVALRHAAWAVWSGRCDVALAIGYEKTTALEPGGVVPAATGPWDRFPPQLHYAIEANRWLHDRGCGPEVLAAVAAKSWNQARRNPRAARQADHEVTADEVLAARTVATPLTRMMCHAAVDGAAAIVVTREPVNGSVALRAIEQSSAPDDPTWPTEGPVVGPPSQTTMTARRAYLEADVDARDVDVVSLHDMCTSEEIGALAALDLASDEELVELATTGGLATGGRLPTNTDGGCIARGHPIGATGLAQAGEIVLQLRNAAGDRQVHGATIGLVQAAGGGGSCAVALLVR